MQHRDMIIIRKIINEIDIAADILEGVDFKKFNESEMLKRSICMTVINIGELVKICLLIFGLQLSIYHGKTLQVFAT